jgi:hypothetical protein
MTVGGRRITVELRVTTKAQSGILPFAQNDSGCVHNDSGWVQGEVLRCTQGNSVGNM